MAHHATEPATSRGPTFAVLGPLQVTTTTGDDSTPKGPLQRRLLAALIARRGRVVSVDELAEVLWPSRLPTDHSAALQTHVFRLRQHVPAGTLEQQPPGYRLRIEGIDVDVDRFEALVSEGSARRNEDPIVARQLLADALALWRGTPYDDLAEQTEVAAEIARLDEVRLRAVEDRLETFLDTGDESTVVSELEALVSREPLRERPRRLLMRALDATGRRAEALRVFDDYRLRLAGELGVDPSIAFRDEHDELVRSSPGRSRTVPGTSASADQTAPRPVTDLLGRDDVVAMLFTALHTNRLVTLVGTGGVGKTRLAQHGAHELAGEFPDGVWWCELAGVEPGSVAEAIDAALGIEPRAGVGASTRLGEVLGGRQALVVLDNCEHVVDDVAALVEGLLTHTDGVTVLATSRERLAVTGEQLVPVPPLRWSDDNGTAPAVALFAERARAADPTFTLDDGTRPTVVDICRRLDGLPLAIELAATRLHALGLAEVRRGLDHTFSLLVGGRRTVARHRSLGAALAWSYDLLDERDREALVSLAVLAGPFTAADAARILDRPAPEARTAVAGLAERSLLQADGDRFTMLETVRQFAADQASAGRWSAMRDRHAAHAALVVEEAATALRGDQPSLALDRVRSTLPDLRLAFHHAIDRRDVESALRLTVGLRDLALNTMLPEPLGWAAEAAALAKAADDPRGADASAVAALGAWKSGDLDLVDQLMDDANAECERLGSPDRFDVLDMLGTLHLGRGRPALAVESYRRALDVSDGMDGLRCTETEAIMVICLAYAHDPAAQDAAERILREPRPGAGIVGEAWRWYAAGEAVLEHDPELARERLRHAVERATFAGSAFVAGVAGASLTSLDVRAGDVDAAIEGYRWLLPRWQRAGVPFPLWTMLRSVVVLLAQCGHDAEAATLLGAVTESPTAMGVFGDDDARLRELGTELSDRLGAERFAELLAGGSGMDDAAATNLAAAAFDRIDDQRLTIAGRRDRSRGRSSRRPRG